MNLQLRHFRDLLGRLYLDMLAGAVLGSLLRGGTTDDPTERRIDELGTGPAPGARSSIRIDLSAAASLVARAIQPTADFARALLRGLPNISLAICGPGADSRVRHAFEAGAFGIKSRVVVEPNLKDGRSRPVLLIATDADIGAASAQDAADDVAGLKSPASGPATARRPVHRRNARLSPRLFVRRPTVQYGVN